MKLIALLFLFLISGKVNAEPTVLIGAVGDIMMGSNYPGPILPSRPEKLFADSAPIFHQMDISFGNFEGTFGTGGVTGKSGPNSHAFRTPPEYVDLLAEAGFDVMSLANNHAMDFGSSGLQNTKQVLASKNIQYSARDGGIAKLEANGLKIALIAASTYGDVYNINSPENIWQALSELNPKFDMVIISVHAGAEGKGALHVPKKTQHAFGQNRGDVEEFAHDAIDRGADLLLMHGPHVPRAMEVYKERLVAYSLGNFCTYGRFGLSGASGYAPLLEVQLDHQGKFLRGQVHSFLQTSPGGPVFDKNAQAAKLMETLSHADFPNTSPVFDRQGGVTPRPL